MSSQCQEKKYLCVLKAKKRFTAHIVAGFLDQRVQVDLHAGSDKMGITTSWSNLMRDISRHQAVRIDPNPPSRHHLPAKVRSKDLYYLQGGDRNSLFRIRTIGDSRFWARTKLGHDGVWHSHL